MTTHKCAFCEETIPLMASRHFSTTGEGFYCSIECKQKGLPALANKLRGDMKKADQAIMSEALMGKFKDQEGITRLPNGEALVDTASAAQFAGLPKDSK